MYPSDKNITVITNNEKGELKLFDFLGKEILQKSIAKEKQITLDISSLSNGIYFLQFQTATGVYSSKVVKE
jgi:spore germination protein YaaH